MKNEVPDGTMVTLTGPRDNHGHLRRRKGGMMEKVVLDVTAEFCSMVVMPNPDPPITTTALAREYRDEINSVTPSESNCDWVLPLYLTDETKADDVLEGIEEGVVQAVKYMPANGSTNTARAVTKIEKLFPLFEKLEEYTRANGRKKKIPVLLHGEVVGENIDPFDSERIFYTKAFPKIRKRFPALPFVFEHISTKEAAWYIDSCGNEPTWATVTPQHMLFDRRRIFQSGETANGTFRRGLFPSMVCWPLLKERKDLAAIQKLAKSKRRHRLGLGSDRAPHRHFLVKVPLEECGAGGCYQWQAVLPMYAWAYEKMGALNYLQEFACNDVPMDVYELPQGKKVVRLIKDSEHPTIIPPRINLEEDFIVPMLHGEKIPWRIEMVE